MLGLKLVTHGNVFLLDWPNSVVHNNYLIQRSKTTDCLELIEGSSGEEIIWARVNYEKSQLRQSTGVLIRLMRGCSSAHILRAFPQGQNSYYCHFVLLWFIET